MLRVIKRTVFRGVALAVAGACSSEREKEPLQGATTSSTPAVSQAAVQGSIAIEPNPIRVCDGTGVGTATVRWQLSGDIAVAQVHAGQIGNLFAQDGSSSATTGKWVGDGFVFYLVDLAQPPNVLATVTARVTTEGC